MILWDGDAIFQLCKAQRLGFVGRGQSRVLLYLHKEQMLDDAEQCYPARHYVMVDDKLRILAAMKKNWVDRLTTVFPRQGRYALAPVNIAVYSSADITIEHIRDLINYDFSTLIGIPKADCT